MNKETGKVKIQQKTSSEVEIKQWISQRESPDCVLFTIALQIA